MNFLQIKFNYLLAIKLVWVGIFALQFFTPDNKANAESIKAICPGQNSIPRRSFETAKYRVCICIGNQKHPLGYYVRIAKNDGSKITVPLTRKNGETYIAVNDVISYVISPYEMLVTKRGRIVVRERVERASSAGGQAIATGCPEGQNLLVEAVTRSFIVYICGSSIPSSYVGIARSGSSKITLPLLSQKSQEEAINKKYVAIEGNIKYTLTRDVLQVYQDGQSIIKEKVLHWN